ncbi:MAG: phosphoethanolamine transferase [Helicobacteraceae bacterium]|nr:phosphoethanolamine transferase [Helicobacteraceae bacterium]
MVLIIGESTQRNYLSLYGFPLQTSPFLQRLKNSGNLFTFSDVVAPHAATNNAIKKLLTFDNYENAQTPFYKKANLIDILKEANYKTQLFSNQEKLSTLGSIPEAIFSRADIKEYALNYATDRKANRFFDEKLLELYEKKALKTKKDFYIFHLLGTHADFKKRYDKSKNEVSYFNKDDLSKVGLDTLPNGEKLGKKPLSLKLDYINAVAYNDFVVWQILEKFKDENAIVFYLSDHGEEVYNNRNFVGRTEHSEYSSRFMVEIPFMIFTSDKFKESYPQVVEKIKKAEHLPLMSDDFMHSFLDLLGFKAEGLVESRSMFSESFNKNRIRLFDGKNYDLELKGEYPFDKASKVWLHASNEIDKFKAYEKKYLNFELDVWFFDGYFDVGHDGKETSIGLNLREMLKAVKNREVGEFKDSTKLWLDFKNLSEENKLESLKELIRICDEFNFKRQNLIIESGNFRALKAFKDSGFFTSYYVPSYKEKELLENKEKIRQELESVVKSGSVNALSFYFKLYDFIKESKFSILENGEWLDVPLLVWDAKRDMNRALYDPQVKVILRREKGEFR